MSHCLLTTNSEILRATGGPALSAVSSVVCNVVVVVRRSFRGGEGKL